MSGESSHLLLFSTICKLYNHCHNKACQLLISLVLSLFDTVEHAEIVWAVYPLNAIPGPIVAWRHQEIVALLATHVVHAISDPIDNEITHTLRIIATWVRRRRTHKIDRTLRWIPITLAAANRVPIAVLGVVTKPRGPAWRRFLSDATEMAANLAL